MSRRIVPYNKKVEKPMFCKICKDAGESAQVFSGHNIRDLKGKVCCPNVMCRNCGMKGSHFDNECVRTAGSIRKEVLDHGVERNHASNFKEATKKVVMKVSVKPTNAFADLALDSDSESDPPPANVTMRSKKPKPISWADWESDDEDEGDVSFF
jgi:hypothetical protein